MIDFDQACALVRSVALPLGKDQVPVKSAHRRVLAESVVAMVDSPPGDVSAMDGYAFREADLPQARLVGASFPGAPYGQPLEPGECVRIFTGAAVPPGADRVVIQEIVRQENGRAVVEGDLAPARHIRRQGSDFSRGDILLPAGRILDARALVAAGGADLENVEVWRRPRVSILGTGDELVEPGTARGRPGMIPESVSLGVAALVQDWGGAIVASRRLRDDPAELEKGAASALAQSDLVVVTGGASVGEKDYAKSMFEPLGLDLIFSKVAIKPGKPVWLGRVQDVLVVGLPGNPTSALVTARLLLAPLIAGLCGTDPRVALRWRSALLSEDVRAGGDRETFVRAGWSGESVRPFANEDSGAQYILAAADLLIRRPAHAKAARAGDMVEIIDF